MMIRLQLALSLALLPVLAVPAFAEAPVSLGRFQHWDAYKLTRGGETTCYVASEPRKILPRKVNRGKILFLVSHWPGRSVFGEPSVITGYTYRDGSMVTVNIDAKKFQLFTKDDGAWVSDPKDEAALVTAMRKGSNMVVKGTSSRGTLTTDTYSLMGISNALDKIDAACK